LKKLPKRLGELNSKRKSEAHEHQNICKREDVAPFIKDYFGINKQGILPFLAKKLYKNSKR